jgi:hypothetical protein
MNTVLENHTAVSMDRRVMVIQVGDGKFIASVSHYYTAGRNESNIWQDCYATQKEALLEAWRVCNLSTSGKEIPESFSN